MPYTLGIASLPDIGGNNGTLIGSFISTTWAKVDTTKHNWICSKTSLIGKTAEVQVQGTLLFSGKVDLVFTIYDQNSESKFSISKIDIDASGGQISDTKVRGKLLDMMGKINSGNKICAQ